MKPKQRRLLMLALLVCLFLLVAFTTGGQSVHAAGLVDSPTPGNNEYAKHPLDNYQLDFFADTSWDWLPWNWSDGVGKSVMFGVYAITNFLWLLSVYLSYACGFLIQQAYSLDFIKDTTAQVGNNMQILAGVSKQGFSADGFYPGLLLIITLLIGIYVAYVGLIKKETSKAISAVINFVVIFITSASFIAYAPDYIQKVNGFSSDISTSALNTGSKMLLGAKHTDTQDGVDAIRDSLFEIQVRQPWTLLQFGDSDAKKVGKDRIEKLAKTSPYKDNGKARTDAVKTEIEDKKNNNLSPVMTLNRLGTTAFIVVFNIAITLFVFFLTAMMLFSQILFIIYATFLPISFLLSMLPSFNGLMKQTIMRLFNTIMTRAGVTLVMTMAFSLSSMVYALSATAPFFMIAFLQVTIFAGIWMKLGDLMGMMQLQSSESQQGAARLSRKGNRLLRQFVRGGATGMFLNRGLKHMQRNIPHPQQPPQRGRTAETNDGLQEEPQKPKSFGQKVGVKAATITDLPNKLADKTRHGAAQIKDAPTNVQYGIHRGVEAVKGATQETTKAFKEQREHDMAEREKQRQAHRRKMQERKLAIKPTAKPGQSGSRLRNQATQQGTPNGPARKPQPLKPLTPKPEAKRQQQPSTPADRKLQRVQGEHAPRPLRKTPPIKTTKIPRKAIKAQGERPISPHLASPRPTAIRPISPASPVTQRHMPAETPTKPQHNSAQRSKPASKPVVPLIVEKPTKPRKPRTQRKTKAKRVKKR